MITLGLQTILSRDFAFSIALVLELSWNLMTEIHSTSKCGARKTSTKRQSPISNPNFSLRTLFWPMELVRHLTLGSSYVLCDSQSNLREREGREKGENSEAPRPSTNTHTLKRERRIPLAAGPRTTHVLQTRRKSTPLEYFNIRYKLYLLHEYAYIKMYWNV